MNHLEKSIFILTILLLILASFTFGVWYERKDVRSRTEHQLEQSYNLYNKKINSWVPWDYRKVKAVNINLKSKFRG